MTNLSFKQLTQIEQIRSIEETCGSLGAVPATAAETQWAFCDWLKLRATHFQKQEPIHSALSHGPQLYHWSIAVLILALTFIGATTTFQALTTGANHTLNIFWILGILLGLNWLSLGLWFVFSFALGNSSGGVIAAAFQKVQRWLLAKNGVSATQSANKAWLSMYFHSNIARWRLGQITHLAWISYLSGGLICLLLLLATQQFDFIWSSTLLQGKTFVSITQALSTPLQLLNIPTPNTEQVLASQHLSSAVDLTATRQSWAYFLLGCILFYGHMPRLLIWLLCFTQQKRAEARAQLNLDEPYYVHLKHKLWPQANRSRIIDPDAPAKPRKRRSMQNLKLNAFPSQAFWIGLELGNNWQWPECTNPENIIGFMHDQNSQEQALKNINKLTQKIIVVLVKAEKPADRGLKRILGEILSRSNKESLWLALAVDDTDLPLAKVQAWISAANDIGIQSEHVRLVEAPQ